MNEPRVCVYTVLLGNYEALNEQPCARESSIPFLCFTDDPELKSDTWRMVVVDPLFPMDSVRSQRMLKIQPGLNLSEYDASIYIDNSVVLKVPPERILEKHPLTNPFTLFLHSFRDNLIDEFLEIVRSGFDDASRVFEQMNHYLIDFPDLMEEKPYWTAILIRDHRDERVRLAQDVWSAHVLRYSRRDQLSVNLAFRAAGLKPATIELSNHESWLHLWGQVR